MDEAGCAICFCVNIKRFRSRKGLSQAKLAERMDISANCLSDIGRGLGWISPFTLTKLANALEIEVFELFQAPDAASGDVLAVVNRCLDDFSASLRVSFEKSLAGSRQKISKTPDPALRSGARRSSPPTS